MLFYRIARICASSVSHFYIFVLNQLKKHKLLTAFLRTTKVKLEIVDNSVNIGLVNQRNYHVQANLNPKNKWVAFILCLFFGIFGAHKFYEGRPLLGVLYIFTVGLLGIGWLADLIILLSKPHIYYVK